MGVQQTKPYNERLILQADKQQYLPRKRISNDVFSQQARIKSVMYNQSVASVSIPGQCITVANFAKIKTEPLSFNDNFDGEPFRKELSEENQDIFSEPEETIGLEVNSLENAQENMELETASQPTVDLKWELLAAHDVSSTETVIQNDAVLPLTAGKTNAESRIEVQSPIKSEVADECEVIESSENSVVIGKGENKSRIKLQKEENVAGVFKNTKLVKNPLAFLKKNCDKVRNEFQERCLNNNIKLEAKQSDEELEISNSWKTTESSKYKSASAIKLESTPPRVNLDDVVIKSEDFTVSETNKEFTNKPNLYQTCLSCNLDSSLDVNLSRENSDSDEVSSKHFNKDVISSISLNTTPVSLEFFSTVEVSSDEEDVKSFQNSQLKKNIETRKKRKPYKKQLNQDNKICKARNFQTKKQVNKRLQGKPKSKKYKPKKYSEKDTPFKSGFKGVKLLKNLPKRAIKTRKNSNKTSPKKKIVVCAKAEFPKPFKLEPGNSQNNQSVPVELPKPMMFKSELTLSSKNKRTYLKPEFQPFVRLKRLKSEELLVPLKIRHSRRARTFKGTSETRSDFLIKQAYSLNPCIKFNRLSMDNNSLYCNEQRVVNSVLSDVPNESVSEMDTKYFTTRERFSFFQSSTPDGSSMFGGPIDSGISTSTPSSSHYSHYNFNRTLLMKIAAERAFINNHLIRFGFSPIQFDLYNNLNELNVFLKFLFGNMYGN